MHAGLVEWVPEADMLGRRVAVLCNLKPAKMRGEMSHGMVRHPRLLASSRHCVARCVCTFCSEQEHRHTVRCVASLCWCV